MDMEKEIRRAVDTGKVLFGFRECEKNVLKGIGKLLIVSDNLESEKKEKLKYCAELSEIPCFDFEKSSLALGALCGKPHAVSAMLILDPGKSKILEITKKSSEKK